MPDTREVLPYTYTPFSETMREVADYGRSFRVQVWEVFRFDEFRRDVFGCVVGAVDGTEAIRVARKSYPEHPDLLVRPYEG